VEHLLRLRAGRGVRNQRVDRLARLLDEVGPPEKRRGLRTRQPLRDDAREARLAVAEQAARALSDERIVDSAPLTQPLENRLALRRQFVRREPALRDRRFEAGG